MTEIRIASADDAELLTVLNRAIHAPHAAMAPEFFKAELDEVAVTGFFREALADEAQLAAIAELDGQAVGYVLVERAEKPESPFTFGNCRLLVHHLVVIETARRKGVASALMNWAQEHARACGAQRLVLDHLAVNTQAEKFYEALGYSPLRVTCSKEV